MNLLRPLCINPKALAQNCIHGIYDYAKTLIGPPGTKIQIYNKDRRSWDEKSFDRLNIGPNLNHYRVFQCYNPQTKTVLDGCDTIGWVDKNNPISDIDPKTI